LVEVALAAVFAEQSHYTKPLKRHLGLTPAEYQKNFRAR
jgi:transcriptional regulator GlxA family with amidase domain